MVLLYGPQADEIIQFMALRLRHLSLPFIYFDSNAKNDVHIEFANGTISGVFFCKTRKKYFDISKFSGCFIRLYPVKLNLSKHSTLTQKEKSIIELDNALTFNNIFNTIPIVVVNRPKFCFSNNSKPLQKKILSMFGLLTPDTLITNDANEINKFYTLKNKKIIYKSISGVRSIVQKLKTEDFNRFESLEFCPVQFQEFIEGDNIRVHVVGDKVFPTLINSNDVDYRYPENIQDISYHPIEIPKEVSYKCIEISKALNLHLSGIDFKRCPKGNYYCFEINPTPAFYVYEKFTRQEISLEVIKLLTAPPAQTLL